MTDAPNSRQPSATNHDSDSRLHRRGYKDDANVRATAKPIPDVPPTITTRLPCNLLVKKFVGIVGQVLLEEYGALLGDYIRSRGLSVAIMHELLVRSWLCAIFGQSLENGDRSIRKLNGRKPAGSLVYLDDCGIQRIT